MRGVAFYLIVFALFVVILSQCRSQNSKENKELQTILQLLIRNRDYSLGMFGDSIMAFWPVETTLDEYFATKIAYPIRGSSEILSSVKQDGGRYGLCLINGGVNDFLGNYVPEDKDIEATAETMSEATLELLPRCGRTIFLNTWHVEMPWPRLAAEKLNMAYKAKVTFTDRLDCEAVIESQMLLDGGHLSEDGYRAISASVRALDNAP